MPSSTMWTTVFQTTAMYAACQILTHHASENIFQDVWENPAVMNLTAITKNVTVASNTTNTSNAVASKSAFLPTGFSYEKDGLPIDHATADRLIEDAIKDMGKGSDEPSELSIRVTLENGTVLNKTLSIPKVQKEPEEQKEPFYTKELPLEVVAYLFMCTLQYCWLLALERALPARSRRRDVVVKEKDEMDEDREEEVVKKWIAQGRVRRASLNWCNTLLKWILGLTVGRVWYYAVLHVVRRSLRLGSPRKTLENMLEVVAINYVGSLVYITPLAELIAFVAVPAYKQILFVAGADLACHVFLVTVVGKLAGWAVQTDFAQSMIRNMTEGVVQGRERDEAYRMFKNEL